MSRLKEFLGKFQTAVWIILFLVLWELVSRMGIVNTFLLPPFSKVAKQFCVEILQGKLGLQIMNSLLLVLEGFVISFVLAIVISIGCIYSKVMEGLFHSLCTIMNPLPGMAILPLIMMWFGVDSMAMLMLIVHGVLWPLVTNLTTGFRSIPVIYKEWGRNIGLNPMQMLKDIYIGAIMSYIIAGLRVGWGRAWRALISAEMVFGMIGELGGVGYYIYQNRAYANSTNVMVGVVAIIIIGVFVEQVVFRFVEKRTILKWGIK